MEKPIIFNGEMVRAILDCIKKHTRRVTGFERINKHPDKWKFIGLKTELNGEKGLWAGFLGEGSQSPIYIKCPWKVGTHLWVRETWTGDEWCGYAYKADRTKLPIDCGEIEFRKWKPSIHMPRCASRLTLEVKEIRVERLQDISEEDSWKEGVIGRGITRYGKEGIDLFHILWNSINEKRGYGWDVNPWVWVVSFVINKKSLKRNK